MPPAPDLCYRSRDYNLAVRGGRGATAVRPIKPVACFCVFYRDPVNRDKQLYHRAAYLARRTLKGLVTGIAAKYNIESTRILRVTHVLPNGLEVEVDDDIVREMVAMTLAWKYPKSQLKAH